MSKIDEAIEYFDQHRLFALDMLSNPEKRSHYIERHVKMTEFALLALREKRERERVETPTNEDAIIPRENDEPLSIDEIIEHYETWFVAEYMRDGQKRVLYEKGRVILGILAISNYTKTWLAYADKPEGV